MIKIKKITMRGVEITDLEEIKQMKRMAQAQTVAGFTEMASDIAKLILRDKKKPEKDPVKPETDKVPEPTDEKPEVEPGTVTP